MTNLQSLVSNLHNRISQWFTARWWRVYLLAGLGYLVLILVLLGPLTGDGALWGGITWQGMKTDTITHFNLLQWHSGEICNGNLIPTRRCDWLFPDCGSLFPLDLVGAHIMAPMSWLFGVSTGWNLLVVINLLFGCMAMFGLIAWWRSDYPVAFVSGVVYGLSPVTIGNVWNGVSESLQTGWLPLFVMAVMALFSDAAKPRTYRRTLGCISLVVAAWWFVAVSNWYFAVIATLLFAGMSYRELFSRPYTRRVLVRIIPASLVFVILILPVVVGLIQVSAAPDSFGTAPRDSNWMTAIRPMDVADPATFFVPDSLSNSAYLHLTYLGYSVPVLLLLGLWLRRISRRAVIGWLLGAGLFVILAMGPVLVVGREVFHLGQHDIPLPYAFLQTNLPFFGWIRMLYRFFVGVHLCLALGLAAAWAGWRATSHWRPLAAVGLAVVLMLEVALLSGARVPVGSAALPSDEAASYLAAQEDTLAVLDLPVTTTVMPNNVYHLSLYAGNQSIHRRPIPYVPTHSPTFGIARSLMVNSLLLNVLERAAIATEKAALYPPFQQTFRPDQSDLSSTDKPARSVREAFERIHSFQPTVRRILSCQSSGTCKPEIQRRLRQNVGALVQTGFGYVVLHRQLLVPDVPLEKLCREIFGEPVWESTDVVIWNLVD